MTGYNSYVAPHAGYEFQVDLFYFKDKEREYHFGDYNYGLLAIDTFSKYVWVIPLTRKRVPHWRTALGEIFKHMGKQEVIYSDPDASMDSNDIKQYLSNKNINWIRTRQHAGVAERAIRTFKNELYKRMEQPDHRPWWEYIDQILHKINHKMVSVPTGMTPEEARKDENDFHVRTSLIAHSVKKREYPNLNIGDLTNVYKKRDTFSKERTGHWDTTTRKVTSTTMIGRHKIFPSQEHYWGGHQE